MLPQKQYKSQTTALRTEISLVLKILSPPSLCWKHNFLYSPSPSLLETTLLYSFPSPPLYEHYGERRQDWAKWIIIIYVRNHFIIFISIADLTACNFIHLLSFVKHSLILPFLYLFRPFLFILCHIHIWLPVVLSPWEF